MKRHAPATARNSEPIRDVLAKELPASGSVLEIASGTGEHALFFARAFPDLAWQPTDFDPEALASIDAYAAEAGIENIRPALALDAASSSWPVWDADAVICINMVHIAPWQASEGLFNGAGKLLGTGAPLILYGPLIEPDRLTTDSNLAFDRSLKARNPAWGLRSTEALDELALANGLRRAARYEMPANNLMLIYRRAT